MATHINAFQSDLNEKIAAAQNALTEIQIAADRLVEKSNDADFEVELPPQKEHIDPVAEEETKGKVNYK